jgi:uncharacterized C2H2 Zn-finger protein
LCERCESLFGVKSNWERKVDKAGPLRIARLITMPEERIVAM